MKKYIVALDEGTTSAHTIVFDIHGRVVASDQKEFSLSYPQPGWVEMDPEQVLSLQQQTMENALTSGGIDPEEIAALAIANQRETTVVWNRRTGRPVYPGIVWQCRRTADECERILRDGWADRIRKKTGLTVDAYFSATKISWILNHVPGAREAAEAGDLLFGTVDTWLLWHLTGRKVHATDRTNASRTMLYNIHTLAWDSELLDLFGIPASMMPQVKSSGEMYGEVDIHGTPVPLAGIAGDQQAALFGQKCFEPGEAKCTYGTGCFLLMQTGGEALSSRSGLLTTVAASEAHQPVCYALEGSVFVGGAVIQWIRDSLGLIERAKDSEACALAVKDTAGVYIVPAFAGLGAPYWDMYARGTIVGLTRGCEKNHIVRAAVESIAYQSHDLIDAMEKDIGGKIRTLKADGGACANRFLMQFQADISQTSVVCGQNEATALGAAFLAGLAVGFWPSREALRALGEDSLEYRATMEETKRSELLRGWRKAIKQTRTHKED